MTTQRLIQRTRIFFLVAGMVIPAAGFALEPVVAIADYPAERRVVITLGSIPTGGEVVHRVELPNGGMLHRLSLEVPVSASLVGWHITVIASGEGGPAHLARLDAHRPDYDLPRPLGFLVAQGDSLRIEIRLAEQASGFTGLRIVLHYERLDAPRSRLAVIPVRATTADHAPVTRSWEWIAPVTGRLISVAGLTVLSPGELVLVDVESGAVLWRGTVQPAAGEAFAAPGAVRAGAQVQAGRSYRLVAVGDRDVPVADAQNGLVQALLLPGARHASSAGQ
jgi:hypothetical protein